MEKENVGNQSAWGETMKWAVGTLILGTAGIIVSLVNGCNDREIRRTEIDSKSIQSVISIRDSSNNYQVKYLNDIRPLIVSKMGTKFINDRIDSLKKRIELLVIVEAEQISKEIEKSSDSIYSKNQQIELRVLADKNIQNETDKQLSIMDYKQAVSKITGDKDTIINNATKENIENAVTAITQEIVDEYMLIGSPQTEWCKEGYFVEYNETLRIGINDLNKNHIEFNMKDITDKKKLIRIEGGKKYSLNTGSNLSILHNNYKYVISLNYIGAAGKNPFTNAAYISVATYRKL